MHVCVEGAGSCHIVSQLHVRRVALETTALKTVTARYPVAGARQPRLLWQKHRQPAGALLESMQTATLGSADHAQLGRFVAMGTRPQSACAHTRPR